MKHNKYLIKIEIINCLNNSLIYQMFCYYSRIIMSEQTMTNAQLLASLQESLESYRLDLVRYQPVRHFLWVHVLIENIEHRLIPLHERDIRNLERNMNLEGQ